MKYCGVDCLNKSFRVAVDILKTEEKSSGEFYIEGYASTSDLDRQGEIITLDALKDTAKNLVEVNSTVFYGHEYDLSNAIGRIVDATVDDTGLLIKIYISSWAKELRTKVREGIISKFSIGGRVIQDSEYSWEEAVKRGFIKEDLPKLYDKIRVIEKIELFEVSLVGVPANPQAQLISSISKALELMYKGGESVSKELEKKEEIKEETSKEEVVDEKKEEESKEENQATIEATENKTTETEPTNEEKTEDTSKEDQKTEESSKEETTEEDIKDLLEEETEPDDDKAKKPYYYYYGRELKEKIDKMGEALARIEEAIKKLTDLIKDKVKTIEIHEEKKSIVDTKDPIEKKETQEDPDELFYKRMLGR